MEPLNTFCLAVIVFLSLPLPLFASAALGANKAAETAKTARENFAKFDADKDGFLTGEEFRATFVADFTAMDTDKDGNLTADEYEKAQGQQMQGQQQHQH